MRHRILITCATTFLAATLTPPATPADPPPKLKTQTILIKALRDFHGDPNPRDIPIELVQLPPGRITLADDKDQEHTIKPIWIAKYETRWDEYEVFWQRMDLPFEKMDAERDWKSRVFPPYLPPYGGDDPSTRGQTWGRAGLPRQLHPLPGRPQILRLAQQTHRPQVPPPHRGRVGIRLPRRRPALAPDRKALDTLAWFIDNADNKTHPVGRKKPNPWGLYDMLGNVGEFVIRDPTDTKGLLAGGAYIDAARDVSSGAREHYSPNWQKSTRRTPRTTNGSSGTSTTSASASSWRTSPRAPALPPLAIP